VYALGITLWEIVERRPPFELESFADLVDEVLNENKQFFVL
jgi:hypothetical protein